MYFVNKDLVNILFDLEYNFDIINKNRYIDFFISKEK